MQWKRGRGRGDPKVEVRHLWKGGGDVEERGASAGEVDGESHVYWKPECGGASGIHWWPCGGVVSQHDGEVMELAGCPLVEVQ